MRDGADIGQWKGEKMTPKQYLNQIQILDAKIRNRLEQLNEIKALASGVRSPVMKADRVQVSPSDRMLALVSKWIDKERDIDRLVDEYVDTKDRIVAEINGLDDARYIHILFKRYVELKTLTVISYEMGYEYTWTCALHGEALAAFDEKYLNNPNKPK